MRPHGCPHGRPNVHTGDRVLRNATDVTDSRQIAGRKERLRPPVTLHRTPSHPTLLIRDQGSRVQISPPRPTSQLRTTRSERATPRLLSRCQTDCKIFLLRTTATRCDPFRTPATAITVSSSVSSDTPGSLLRGTIRSRFLLHLRCLFCREAVRGDSSVIHHQHDVSHRLDVFQWIAIQNDQIRFQARQDRTCPL